MNTNARTIHTHLYGDRANEIVRAVSGQLSDGLWENSRGYDKYWTNFDVDRLDDGETVLKVSLSPYSRWGKQFLNNPFLRMSDTEFLAWYAGKLKTVIRAEAKDDNWTKGWWNRDNTADKSQYLNYELDVTVADVYAVYDCLLGRAKRSSAETLARTFAEPRGAEAAAAEKAKREKLEAARAEHEAKANAIEAARKAALAEIEKQYDKLRDDEWNRYHGVLAELKA